MFFGLLWVAQMMISSRRRPSAARMACRHHLIRVQDDGGVLVQPADNGEMGVVDIAADGRNAARGARSHGPCNGVGHVPQLCLLWIAWRVPAAMSSLSHSARATVLTVYPVSWAMSFRVTRWRPGLIRNPFRSCPRAPHSGSLRRSRGTSGRPQLRPGKRSPG